MPDTADSFIPGPDSANALREAFGRFATGVTVVTVPGDAAGPLGITANSFASVSLDPPLLLWCPAKASHRHAALVGAEHFALHIMGAEQDAVAEGFARRADAFDTCEWTLSPEGVPLIAGCAARFECRIRDRIDAGDHTVVIAHVERVTTEEIVPRVFLGGAWGDFSHKD